MVLLTLYSDPMDTLCIKEGWIAKISQWIDYLTDNYDALDPVDRELFFKNTLPKIVNTLIRRK
jgi:hypothetical protein